MSDDRTPDELGIGAVPEAIAQSPAGVAGPVPEATGTPLVGVEQAADGVCQKADWLAPTTELPIAAPPTTAEPGRDRLRRWGREYGGYVAAGALALVVLTCAVAGAPGVDMTWHPGTLTAADPPSPVAQSPTGPAAQGPTGPAAQGPTGPVVSPAAPSPAPSRKPPKRPAVASEPRATSPARSPSAKPSPAILGPSDGWALSGMVNDYCQRRFDRSAMLLRPWRGSGAEDNWACQRRRRTDIIMANMTDACAVRYGRSAVARYLEASDPFSWRCYRT